MNQIRKGLFPMYEFCRGIFGGYGINGFNWFGGVAMLIGVILVGVVIYLLVSNNNRHTTNRSTTDAQDILKERLAKGEIDEETYESLLKKIQK